MRPGRQKHAKAARVNLTIPKNVLDLVKRLRRHGVDVNMSQLATEALEKAATGLLDRLGDPIEACANCAGSGHCTNCAGSGYCARSKNKVPSD